MKGAKPNDVSPLNQDHKITQSIENKKEKCVIFVPNKPNDQGPQKHCHVLPIICLFICLSSSVILLLNYLPQQKGKYVIPIPDIKSLADKELMNKQYLYVLFLAIKSFRRILFDKKQ